MNIIDPYSVTYLQYYKISIKFVLEMLENQHLLRYLQLFHQKPTLPDINILHNTQV